MKTHYGIASHFESVVTLNDDGTINVTVHMTAADRREIMGEFGIDAITVKDVAMAEGPRH